MSANFYLSSHANNHLHPRAALVAARQEDYKHATEQELAFLEIWSASAMQKMCKRLNLRQQVLSTAIVYFRRFYLRNSYCETEPSLVAASCVYVASKAEETPVHVKSAVSEAKAVFNEMGMTAFTSDNNRLAEMEFYLIEELDFHLIVFHPYRALMQLCGKDGGLQSGGEDGRESRRKMLEMEDASFQMAWFIINDTFRSSLCLVHPPHLIALAAIYLSLSMHPPRSLMSAFTSLNSATSAGSSSSTTTGDTTPSGVASRTRRRGSLETVASNSTKASNSTSQPSSHHQPNNGKPHGQTDPLTFLASLEIDQSLLLEIIQEIISLYELWSLLEGPSSTTQAPLSPSIQIPNPSNPSGRGTKLEGNNMDQKMVGLIKRMQDSRLRESREERTKASQIGLSGGNGVGTPGSGAGGKRG